MLLLTLLLPLALASSPVARVLDEDPPLPAEPLVGWEALEPGPPPSDLAEPTAPPLDLEGAVAHALARSPELTALRAEVSRARGAALDAGALPNPTWETRLTGEGQLGLGVEFDVTGFVHAGLAAAAARPEVAAARIRLEEATLRLEYEVRAAYFEHEAAVATWEGSLRALDALAAERDAWRAITAAGNAPVRDLLLREAAYEEARVERAERALDVVGTRERLTRLIGQEPGILAPSPPMDVVPLPDLASVAVGRSLTLRTLDVQIEAGRRARTAAIADAAVPGIGAFAEAEPSGETSAGITLELPLLSFGRGGVVRAEAEVDRLRAVREAAEIQVRSAARELEARFVSAHGLLRHLEEVVVPGRERLLGETLLHYNAMQLDLGALLDAWRARTELEATLADARREARTTEAALDALLHGALVDTPRSARGPSTPASPEGH